MQPNPREQKALDRALRALSMREHSERELVEKLGRAGFDEREIAYAMGKLSDYRLVDDGAFAEKWAASRARRGLGTFRIRQELRQKGVDARSADAALLKIDEEASLEAATRLAQKHLDRGDANALRRAADALKRRGFDYDTIHRAISAVKRRTNAE